MAERLIDLESHLYPASSLKADMKAPLLSPTEEEKPYRPAFININKSSRREGLVYSLLVTAQRPIFIPFLGTMYCSWQITEGSQ